MTETKSTCPYCGVGCGVIIRSDGDRITGVRGDPDHPANFGRLCTKGSTLHLTATAEVTLQTRLLQPLRRAERGAVPQPIDWNTALDTAADKFAQVIRDHGPDAVGFYVSGQLLTEDYYVFNKLAKGLVGLAARRLRHGWVRLFLRCVRTKLDPVDQVSPRHEQMPTRSLAVRHRWV